MRTKTNNQVIDFLVNEDFINYVINPTFSQIAQWEQFFKMHPNDLPFANEARQILLDKGDFITLPSYEALELKSRIYEQCGIALLN